MTVKFKTLLHTYTGTILNTHRSWAGRLYLVIACTDNKIRQVEAKKATIL